MFRTLFCILCMFGVVFGSTYDEIVRNGNVRIGVSPSMPPFSKLNGDRFEGFEIDFARELVNQIFPSNVSITFIGVEQANRQKAVKNNDVDMLIAAYTVNDERAKEIDFSAPYFSIILSIVAKKSDGIKSEADLRGKKIAAIKNSNSDDWLKKKGHSIVYCANNNECYQKVKNGEAVGFMHNIVSTATIPIIDNEFENALNFSNLSYMDCVATQKGNNALVEKINTGIIHLSKNGFFKNKYNETFVPFYKGALDKKYFILDDIYSLMF